MRGAGADVLVVIQQPGGGSVRVLARIKAIGQGPSLLADQVVHPVPARRRLGQQVLSYSASSPRRATARSVPSRAAAA
jgi:hypothetical protein